MSRILIVAEKDSVAKAIALYLSGGRVRVYRIGKVRVYKFLWRGSECTCLGLKGHIMDFDFEEKYNVWTRVKPEVLFNVDPVFVIRPECLVYVRVLRRFAAQCDTVILALDSDSEGEAISYEVILNTYIVNRRLRYYRALFSAVTKREIERAFSSLTRPRPELAKKVFARMILDLTLGAVFTRLLTLSIRKYLGSRLGSRFLSYGPCQSPVLNLVVRRALEREQFKPEKYYTIHIIVKTRDGQYLKLNCTKTFKEKQEAEKIANQLRTLKYITITRVRNIRARISPPKPLDTIELERRLSRFFNIRAKRALDIAEELYRHGYISYPRTETTIYPPTLNLREVLQELLATEHRDYVRRLLQLPKLIPTRGNTDDKAHPPIYPTAGATREEILRKFKRREFWIVYDFVVRHFLATLSPPARILRQEVIAKIGNLEFSAEGVKILELGYWEIYPFEKIAEKPLPEVRAGERVEIVNVIVKENETKPPPYLSESELLKLMREYGIGTDATMQDHIHTNIVRGYFRIVKKRCIPTELGKALIKVLSKYAAEIIDPLFRSRMEKMLSEITNGRDPRQVIEEFKKEAMKYYQILKARANEIGKELADAFLKTFKYARKA